MTRIALMFRQSLKTMKNYRWISLSINNCKNNEEVGDFVPIYKFPYILQLSLVNKLKMYQTALTVTGIPGAAILNYHNYIADETAIFVAALGVSGCIASYSLGYFTDKFVGFIYYNEQSDMMKISYIDFWGRRKEIKTPTEDLIPLSETPLKPLDGLFLTLRRSSSKDILKINMDFGIVLDKEKIKKIL